MALIGVLDSVMVELNMLSLSFLSSSPDLPKVLSDSSRICMNCVTRGYVFGGQEQGGVAGDNLHVQENVQEIAELGKVLEPELVGSTGNDDIDAEGVLWVVADLDSADRLALRLPTEKGW